MAIGASNSEQALAALVPTFLQRRIPLGSCLCRPERRDAVRSHRAGRYGGFTASELSRHLGRAEPSSCRRSPTSTSIDLIETIVAHGGDIVCFAGDAVFVMWPAVAGFPDSLSRATRLAAQCVVAAKSHGATPLASEDRLRLRVTLSAGEVRSLLIGDAQQRYQWLVAGLPPEHASAAQAVTVPGQVVVSRAALPLLAAHALGVELPKGELRLTAMTDRYPCTRPRFRPLPRYWPSCDRARTARLLTSFSTVSVVAGRATTREK